MAVASVLTSRPAILRLLAPSRAGKPTGEAYVEFEEPEEAARALKERQHEHIGSRYIECVGAARLNAPAASAARALARRPRSLHLHGFLA